MPKELGPILKAVLSQDREAAKKEGATLVTSVVKPALATEVSDEVAELVVCVVLNNKDGMKAAMVAIARSALEDEAPPVVMQFVQLLVANQAQIRKHVMAAAKSYKNKKDAAAEAKAEAAEPAKVAPDTSPVEPAKLDVASSP